MSYRKGHVDPPAPRLYRQHIKAPPPTPPELDPLARETDDNTIDEIEEHPMFMRFLQDQCAWMGFSSWPMPSPTWDLVPMLPARVRRIVYVYCWGPPNNVDCQMHLSSLRGRQEWSFPSAHANLSILGMCDGARVPHRHPRRYRARHAHNDDHPRRDRARHAHGDDDSTAESFATTNDGFEDGFEAAVAVPDVHYVNSMQRKPHKTNRRMLNAKIARRQAT